MRLKDNGDIGDEWVIYMKDFEAFFKANKNKVMSRAKANTRYNRNGLATISKKDDWFYDDVWESDFKGVKEADQRKYRSAAD